MKTINTSFIIMIFCLLIGRNSYAQSTNNLVANSRALPAWASSVVKIWYHCGSQSYTGTGVIVSRSGYVLTAAHLGKSCNNVTATKITVGVANSVYVQPQQTYTAILVYQITDANENLYDLKLLKMDTAGGVRLTPAVFSPTLPLPGDEIFMAGFPDLPFSTLSQKEAGLSVCKTSVLSFFAEGNNNIPTRLHYGGNTLPGFSGAPVFDINGNLIGIHSTRSTATIKNLLSTPCSDASNKQNPCFGNAVRFQIPTSNNNTKTQEIHVDYAAVKNVLDNYSWGTSIWRIPQPWLNLMQ